ncbi:MAG: lysylphosphatidylglycerol synthase domain-containing protein, partial [Acidimicrobiia bacterium]
WLLVALVAATGAMVWIAWCWSHALALVGHDAAGRPDRRRTFAWYFGGEIGKYVPGGVWTVVGRGELARRGGVTASRAYTSVALSLAALYLAGLMVAMALVPLSALFGVRPSATLALLGLLPLGLLALHPRVLGRARAILVRLTGRGQTTALPPWRATIGLIVRYVPAWLMIWAATWCVARALMPDPPVLRIGIATMVSWVAGIAAVPVPAGAGVREATFVALAGLSLGLGATVAVASRLLFIVVDLLGAVLTAPWNVRRATSARSKAPAP